MDRRYWKIMAGSGSSLAETCIADGFVGGDYGEDEDLTPHIIGDEYLPFNRWFIPRFLQRNPEKSKIAAGLSGGRLWTMVRSTRKGDVVVCPTRDGRCSVGLITGGYEFAPGQPLPHRRPVEWVSYEVERLDLGEAAQTAMKAGGTIVELPRTEELERFGLSLNQRLVRAAISNEIENPASFVMEEHLEAFLERNWEMTAFGKNFDLYQEDGEVVGRQFRTDTGPLDLLAVSKDGSRLLVIELKRGRAGDKVVGQILRYMSFVQAECAEPGQKVEGAIVALDDSLEIRRALEQVPHVKFYRYRIDFHLEQG